MVRVELDGDTSSAAVVLGLVTPKRIGVAVTRNRTRRRTRAIVAAAARSGELPPGRYIVSFSAPPPVGSAEFSAELASALRRAVTRARDTD